MNNRELATVILLGVALAWMLASKAIRKSLLGVLKVLASPRLIAINLLLIAWVYLGVSSASRFGLWAPDSGFATVAWFFTGAAAWVMRIGEAGKAGFIAKRIRGLLSVGVLVEFFVNLYPFPLAGELVFQALLFFIAGIGAVAESNPELSIVDRLAKGAMVIAGLAVMAFTLQNLVSNWASLDWWSLALQLLLPVWLTLWTLPFVYAVSLYAGYEALFKRVRWYRDDRRLPAFSVAGLTATLGLSARRVNGFNTTGVTQAARARSFGEVRRAVQEFEAAQREDREARRIARMRLERYAGVKGTYADGRQLDRREFAETKRALEWVATCSEGWYGRGNRYRHDLMEVLSDLTGEGLPQDHGVTMRVRRDGQGWYAFRQTPSGYWFGIGATPKSYRWYYDGFVPPTGFPTRKGGWTDDTDDTRAEWLPEDPA